MSEENVEVVRKAIAYEYDGVGDRAEAEAIFDPHVVMNPFHAVDQEPSYGPDAMRDDWERWASAFEDLTVTFEEFIDAGDQVVVVAHHQGRGRKSGVEVDTRYFEVYTLREGKVSQIDEYDDRADALEAAGLSEQAMSQENVWHLEISFIGSGEDGARANGIIVTARKRGKPVYGEGPLWSVSYEKFETRGAALAALSFDLDEIDPDWRDVLEVR